MVWPAPTVTFVLHSSSTVVPPAVRTDDVQRSPSVSTWSGGGVDTIIGGIGPVAIDRVLIRVWPLRKSSSNSGARIHGWVCPRTSSGSWFPGRSRSVSKRWRDFQTGKTTVMKDKRPTQTSYLESEGSHLLNRNARRLLWSVSESP